VKRRILPPLSSLRAFEVAARLQSFSKAAEVLSVTHGAVSKQIKNLEENLGVAVFERRPHQLVLTAQGRMLLSSTSKAFDIVESTVREITQRKLRLQRVTVLCDPDFASLWLVPRLVSLREALGGAHIDIETTADPKKEIRKRGDCAIWYGANGDRSMKTSRLFRSTLFPICSAALMATGAPLAGPADLRRHTLLHYRDTREWQRYFKLAGLPRSDHDSGEIFGMYHLTLDAVRQGAGVAIGDDVLCARDLRERKLLRPFGPSFASTNSYFLSINPFNVQPSLIQVLQGWIKSESRSRWCS
jgi:LysR family transcriptional regulator, glycine cleavage system transcriptional activator